MNRCHWDNCPHGPNCVHAQHPAPIAQGEGGAALGEEVRRMIETALVANTEFEAEAADALAELLPIVAALVVHARAGERERIRRAIQEEMPDLAENSGDPEWRDSRSQRAAFRVALECVDPGQP